MGIRSLSNQRKNQMTEKTKTKKTEPENLKRHLLMLNEDHMKTVKENLPPSGVSAWVRELIKKEIKRMKRRKEWK